MGAKNATRALKEGGGARLARKVGSSYELFGGTAFKARAGSAPGSRTSVRTPTAPYFERATWNTVKPDEAAFLGRLNKHCATGDGTTRRARSKLCGR